MSEVRLIDANKLKEALEENRWYHTLPNGDLGEGANSKTTVPIYLADDVYRLIDNAPTVRTDNYAMGYQDGVRKVLSERSQGKWITDISDDPYMITYGWRCSVCGKRQTHGTPKYCMHCGSKMEE